MTNSHTMHFHLDGVHNREARDWQEADSDGVVRRSIRLNARRHAKEHGAAGLWFATDKLLMYYRDHRGKVLQVTWPRAVPIQCECHPVGA